jgi:hypothetical protein
LRLAKLARLLRGCRVEQRPSIGIFRLWRRLRRAQRDQRGSPVGTLLSRQLGAVQIFNDLGLLEIEVRSF